jgi:S-adenosylmethionine decarboxylase
MTPIFEGSEKKLEVLVRDGISLLQWPEERWLQIVEASQTQILSKIENIDCRAYLLSESSLFVWDDRFTMITCGTTTLVDVMGVAQKYLAHDDIDALIFERKNEYFPQFQKSDFFSDIEKLDVYMNGRAYRFGHLDDHHVYLFHSDKKYRPRKNDTTLEILMYGLQGKAQEIFNRAGQTSEEIRKETGVDRILPDFIIDDHSFSPIGYSLNAIKGPQYYTIHVTPQDVSPYVSFETNLTSRNQMQKTINSVLEVFRPRAFDIVYFDTKNEPENVEASGYVRRSQFREKLACGYAVHYGHFSQGQVDEERPFEITIPRTKS